ncbi:SagB/ThcOx family dehydrogenase [Streptomyces sp. M19]
MVPSAGGAYPLGVYADIAPGRVADLDAGTYYLHPGRAEIVPVRTGRGVPAAAHAEINRAALRQSAFVLYLISRMDAITPLYPELAWDFSVFEAGAMTQLLMTVAAETGLGLCPIGTLDTDAARTAAAAPERPVRARPARRRPGHHRRPGGERPPGPRRRGPAGPGGTAGTETGAERGTAVTAGPKAPGRSAAPGVLPPRGLGARGGTTGRSDPAAAGPRRGGGRRPRALGRPLGAARTGLAGRPRRGALPGLRRRPGPVRRGAARPGR